MNVNSTRIIIIGPYVDLDSRLFRVHVPLLGNHTVVHGLVRSTLNINRTLLCVLQLRHRVARLFTGLNSQLNRCFIARSIVAQRRVRRSINGTRFLRRVCLISNPIVLTLTFTGLNTRTVVRHLRSISLSLITLAHGTYRLRISSRPLDHLNTNMTSRHFGRLIL